MAVVPHFEQLVHGMGVTSVPMKRANSAEHTSHSVSAVISRHQTSSNVISRRHQTPSDVSSRLPKGPDEIRGVTEHVKRRDTHYMAPRCMTFGPDLIRRPGRSLSNGIDTPSVTSQPPHCPACHDVTITSDVRPSCIGPGANSVDQWMRQWSAPARPGPARLGSTRPGSARSLH